jgi:hypothetical protein
MDTRVRTFCAKVKEISEGFEEGVITRGEAKGWLSELCRTWFISLGCCCKDKTILIKSDCSVEDNLKKER